MICKMWLFRPIIGLLRGICVKGLTQYSTSYTVSIQQILPFLLFLLHLILSFSRDQGHDLNIMVTQVLSSVSSVWLVPILLSCYGRKHNPVDSRKSVPIWLNDVVVWMIDPKFLFLCSRYPYPCIASWYTEWNSPFLDFEIIHITFCHWVLENMIRGAWNVLCDCVYPPVFLLLP